MHLSYDRSQAEAQNADLFVLSAVQSVSWSQDELANSSRPTETLVSPAPREEADDSDTSDDAANGAPAREVLVVAVFEDRLAVPSVLVIADVEA